MTPPAKWDGNERRAVPRDAVGLLNARLNQHLDEAEARFDAVVSRMDRADTERAEILTEIKALRATEDQHDAILHQVNGGIKVLKFIGWLLTGGLAASVFSWWRKVFGAE